MGSIWRHCLGVCVIGASLFVATPSYAKITWDLQPPGTGAYDWTLREHWVFDRNNATDSTYHPCDDCTYHSLGGNSGDERPNVSWGGGGSGAAPECLEITTYPGVITPNPDTVIELRDSNYNWQMVSDDFNGTWQSHARIWIDTSPYTMVFDMRVRAYSTPHNQDDFQVSITRRDLSRTQCTSDQNLMPWAQIDFDQSAQPIITMSNFH